MTTEMPGCRWVRDRLPLLAGDDWLGPDRRPIERHLRGCDPCRAHLDSLRDSASALRLAAEDGPAPRPESIWPALALQIRDSRRPAPMAARRPWGAPLLRLSVAAGLLASAAIAGAQLRGPGQLRRVTGLTTTRSTPAPTPRARPRRSTPAPAVAEASTPPAPLPGTYADGAFDRATPTSPRRVEPAH